LPSITVNPSIAAVKSPSHCPSLPIAIESITVESPFIAIHCCPPSIAIHRCPIHYHLPSIAIHRRGVVFAPSIAVLVIEPSIVCRIAITPSTVQLPIVVTLSIVIETSIPVAFSITLSCPTGCGCRTSSHLVNASCPPVQEFPHGVFNLFLMHGTIL
jgi:hypothetical protein